MCLLGRLAEERATDAYSEGNGESGGEASCVWSSDKGGVINSPGLMDGLFVAAWSLETEVVRPSPHTQISTSPHTQISTLRNSQARGNYLRNVML